MQTHYLFYFFYFMVLTVLQAFTYKTAFAVKLNVGKKPDNIRIQIIHHHHVY